MLLCPEELTVDNGFGRAIELLIVIVYSHTMIVSVHASLVLRVCADEDIFLAARSQ